MADKALDIGESQVIEGKANSSRPRRKLPVELASIAVKGLFGLYDHSVQFPHAGESEDDPALVILHGQNGVGKTTLLLMLDGIMRLDFDVFRVRPFEVCRLKFSSGKSLVVRSAGTDGPLDVRFGKHRVLLHPTRKGALELSEQSAVEDLRQAFKAEATGIRFQLITTARAPRLDEADAGGIRNPMLDMTRDHLSDSPEIRLGARLRAGPPDERQSSLSGRVRRFILDAQVDYRQFFRTEYDLFSRIFAVVQEDQAPTYDTGALLEMAARIRHLDRTHGRLGLQTDQWDYGQVVDFLKAFDPSQERAKTWALAALGAYIEGLESRAQQRNLLAERLTTFERVMNEFLLDKSVQVGTRGVQLQASNKNILKEDQLSSGEFHLLYLMVEALIARRRGTIIAIDEPEMSMHISWQHRLIRNLLAVASDARPQLVLATHSPDVIAEYRPYLVQLGPDGH